MVHFIGDSMETNTSLKIFCIIILIILNVLIVLNGRTLSCDKCVITFHHERDMIKQEMKINISELYEYFKQDKCLIEFKEFGIVKND